MIDLKNEFKNIKNDNYNIKQELIMLKIDKSLDEQQSDNEQDEHNDGDESSQQALLSDKGTPDTFTDPQLLLLTNYFLQNGLQKLKLLFLMIIILLLFL